MQECKIVNKNNMERREWCKINFLIFYKSKYPYFQLNSISISKIHINIKKHYEIKLDKTYNFKSKVLVNKTKYYFLFEKCNKK